MQIRWERLKSSRPREIGLNTTLSPTLWCFASREPGAVLSVGPGMHVLWVCLAGKLSIESGDLAPDIGYRQTYLSLGEGSTRGFANGRGVWLALVLPSATVAAELKAGRDNDADRLYSVPGRLDRNLLACVSRLMRSADVPSMTDWFRRYLTSDLIRSLVQSQAGFDRLVQRCPGKTMALRRLVLHRLLRVRQRLEFGKSKRLSVGDMARISSYSTCHFIRVFEAVFEESPFNYSLRWRMDQALALLQRRELAVTEIADRLGFSTSAAFARAFRSYFGITATEARRLQQVEAGQRGHSIERLAHSAVRGGLGR